MRQAQSYMVDKKTREWLEKQRVLREAELDNLESKILETASFSEASRMVYTTHWRYLGDDFREDTIQMLRDNGFDVVVRDENHIIISWTDNDREI